MKKLTTLITLLVISTLSFAAENDHYVLPLGLQVYSLREMYAKDPAATLALIKQMGFTEVEAAGFKPLTAAQYRAELDKNGLKAVSEHVQYADLQQHMDQVIADAKTIGVSYVVTPWVPHKGTFTVDDAHRTAADFNKFGRQLKDAGLRFGYHAHGYEFTPTGNGDETAFDVLMKETDPALVTFEMDVFWIVHPGQDPVAVMKKYPTRFSMLHLKDMKKGTPTGPTAGKAPKDSSVALGTGQIDYRAVIKQAQSLGVQHMFIEDEAPDAPKQIPVSVEFLKTVKF